MVNDFDGEITSNDECVMELRIKENTNHTTAYDKK